MKGERAEKVDSLNLFKLFACIGVLLIHCPFPGSFGVVCRACGKVGVPFFLMISGFFLMNSNMCLSRERITNKSKHIFYIIIESSLFYLAFHIIKTIISKRELSVELSQVLDYHNVVDFLVTNSPLFYPHLWFLFALLYCYFLTYLVSYNYSGKWKVWVMIFGILVFVSSSEIGRSCNIPYSAYGIVPFNIFFFRALPFFLMGSIIREYVVGGGKIWTVISNASPRYFIIALICCMGISIIEAKYIHESQYYVSTVFSAAIMIIYCCVYKKSIHKVLETVGEKHSLYIYIYHVAVYQFIINVLLKMGIRHNIYVCWSIPVVVFVLSLLMAIITVYLKNRIKMIEIGGHK